MSRFSRLRRGPDVRSDAHERARTRLAERMDMPLAAEEAAWLDEHLVGCAACSAIAAGYEDDRLALRALRDTAPEPPRDLWARTSAAIEAGSGASPTGKGIRSLPLGALSGLTVIAIVVGVSLMSGSIPVYQGGVTGEGQAGSEGPGSASATPTGLTPAQPTPIVVGDVTVGWIDGAKGAYHRVTVDEVCAADGAPDCPVVRDADQFGSPLSGTPRSIVGSPTQRQAIAISKTADAGDEVVVVALPDQTQRPAQTAEPTASASVSAAPSAEATTEPTPSADASGSSEPSASPAVSSAPSASPVASIEPSATPSETAATVLAIASGIEVVGESAAFSPDGHWFAFTARQADGSDGTDVYTWRVGDEKARALTDDGDSYFASWAGARLIVSRPDDVSTAEPDATSVAIDPANGDERDAGDVWRPAVDPTGSMAIVWDGQLSRTRDALTWAPAEGSLELRTWSAEGPGPAEGPERSRVVTDVAPRDFDVRWDETGEWVAVWVADRDDPVVGRLTLFHVDREQTRLEKVDGAPTDVPALPGFSIGDGRLAWATPRGQGGEGSRIQIAAWSKTDVGIVESSPGEDPVVIR
jgi:hypothetical protein